nr:GLPGLI family protein [Elizabethkingia sp. ASV34]
MKFILQVILFFSPLLFFTQNYRVFYEYTFIRDSLSKDNKESEVMILDIDKNSSTYLSYKTYQRDSALAKMLTRPDPSFFIKNATKISDIIIKNRGLNSQNVLTSVKGGSFNVADNRKINWTLLPDSEVFNNYNVKKAKTFMYGRNWIAWYTTEVPIQDGPYKFNGLPGLILKVDDETGSHSFQLIGIKKINKPSVLNINKSKYKPVNEGQYRKLFIQNRKSSAYEIDDNSTRGSETRTYIGIDGKEIDRNTFLKNADEKRKKDFKSNNNIIELDLLKESL